ncbi:hypothetical protein ACHWQZ_G018636 [Mnemiopsis leidyi]
MTRRSARRLAGGNTESLTQSINEVILQDCHSLYIEGDDSLINIGEDLGLSIEPPRKKINIMLIGNHSAGKSSFINWYIEETIQRTGVAIETQGFTLVTSGKRRDTLTGTATVHFYPVLKELLATDKILDYISTEVTTSKQKKFPLITFIDTPGLVDGEMLYPFDVDQAIEWMGHKCDLIFVFFDPIGQALCKRTLNIVEHLNEFAGDKMRFYLTKADTAGTETDRQKVMMQVVQELCKRPGLNKTGFDMPTIYIPSLANEKQRCVNQIEDVCRDIDKSIALTLQSILNTLDKDCDTLVDKIDETLAQDTVNGKHNVKAYGWWLLFQTLGYGMFLLLITQFIFSILSKEMLSTMTDQQTSELVFQYIQPVRQLFSLIPEENKYFIFGAILGINLLCFLLAKILSRTKPRLSSKVKKLHVARRKKIVETIKPKQSDMYSKYLAQCAE